ncbi:hypothetical protein BS47DRAFT_1485335 [Hydnum rufescens UP504]|uniref:Uncharacterized protein n=1 Tax=Hydnum rufescens UP504 TaxID=1448309 RepID=A0A9P6AXT8_9AGAM|nr:hypothetical protein BS47DRAFT_1485335 [Hydnum rufescens UP504]
METVSWASRPGFRFSAFPEEIASSQISGSVALILSGLAHVPQLDATCGVHLLFSSSSLAGCRSSRLTDLAPRILSGVSGEKADRLRSYSKAARKTTRNRRRVHCRICSPRFHGIQYFSSAALISREVSNGAKSVALCAEPSHEQRIQAKLGNELGTKLWSLASESNRLPSTLDILDWSRENRGEVDLPPIPVHVLVLIILINLISVRRYIAFKGTLDGGGFEFALFWLHLSRWNIAADKESI